MFPQSFTSTSFWNYNSELWATLHNTLFVLTFYILIIPCVPWFSQAALEVRLVGKEASEAEGEERVSAGRVEVRYLGVWGTVCDDDFGLEEGHVRPLPC